MYALRDSYYGLSSQHASLGVAILSSMDIVSSTVTLLPSSVSGAPRMVRSHLPGTQTTMRPLVDIVISLQGLTPLIHVLATKLSAEPADRSRQRECRHPRTAAVRRTR